MLGFTRVWKRGHGNHDPSVLRTHGVTICYAIQTTCPDSGQCFRHLMHRNSALARARTTNEQRKNSIARTKGRWKWPPQRERVYGRQKSPPSFLALDIGFTEVRDQWRARLHRLFAGGKWKKPADRCSRRKTNSTAKQRWILNARFVPYLSLKDTKR